GSSDTPADPQAGRTGQAATRSTPGPTPAPVTPSVPAADRKIEIPDSSTTIHESDKDPIKLTSYTLGTGDDYSFYVREANTSQFVKNDVYKEYVPNPSGTHALAAHRYYSTSDEEIVSIVDHRTGGASDIKLTKSPFYSAYLRWSPDGTKGLASLYEANENDDIAPQLYGYAIIDIATKKATVVPVKEQDTSPVWPYFWRGDGRAVGIWVSNNGEPERIRFYDLQGTVLQTLQDVGRPPTWLEREPINPSGTLMITYCRDTDDICVWSATAGGEPKARISFTAYRIIGWYDDRHIAVWRKRGSGYQAVVVDFNGKVNRVLATTTDATKHEQQFLSYTSSD
ncbi:hypothetical protein, partial [Streptosporangium fragile]|uniref:hypothetical protein n=1 Tax=Streptosporangium fragile TaxID=46186 RepID=UPI0031E78A7A